jgi:hypothetical protein
MLSRSDESSVNGYVDSARPAASYTGHHSSPFDYSAASLFKNGLSSSSVEAPWINSQTTSMLYIQIQHLSKQLRVKADETDHIRRQLVTKGSLNDLGA